MYEEIVTQIVMVLPETHLLNALLFHNISVSIRTIKRQGTAREPKVHSQKPTFVPTNNVLTKNNQVIQSAALTGTKNKIDSY